MKTKIIILLLFIISINGFSQNSEYLLQSIEKPNKIIQLKNIRAISLINNDTTLNKIFYNCFEEKIITNDINFSDTIIDINSFEVQLIGYVVDNYKILPKLESVCKTTEYDGDALYYSKKINFKDISVISLENNEGLLIMADMGLILSFFSTLIISPLVSYNFKTQTMNNKIYNTITPISLAGCAFFATIRIPLKGKDYRIKDLYDRKAEWKLIKK